MEKRKHGGKRANSGRKKDPKAKLTQDKSKVCRVSLIDYAHIKSGRYEQLMSLLYDWRTLTAEASKTSPRWQKMKQFFSEIDNIFGNDYDSWKDIEKSLKEKNNKQ